jgi:hypothetical protein
MTRPDSITNEDIKRWSDNIDSDENIPQSLVKNDTIREVCYAGLWLAEQLALLQCPESFITRIQFTAGQASFGRDPWEVHQMFLESYRDNKLDYEVDISELN